MSFTPISKIYISRNAVYFLVFARALFYTDLVSTLKRVKVFSSESNDFKVQNILNELYRSLMS